MNSELKNEKMENLFLAFAAARTPEEAEKLLDDLCTISELQAMSNRLAAARMLTDSCTFNEICEATGLSTATVTRVNRALKYGSGGYRLILNRTRVRGR